MGLWHTLSDKFLHLKEVRCPLAGKGLFMLRLTFIYFFSIAEAPALWALLCTVCFLRVCDGTAEIPLWFLVFSSSLAPPLPPSAFCCVCSLAHGVLLLWEAAVCLAFWWISYGDILSVSPEVPSALLIFTDCTRARWNLDRPVCCMQQQLSVHTYVRYIHANEWVFFFISVQVQMLQSGWWFLLWLRFLRRKSRSRLIF